MLARLVSVALLLGGCSSSAPEKAPETITEEQAYEDVMGVDAEATKLTERAKQLESLDGVQLDELSKAVVAAKERADLFRGDAKHRRAYDTLWRIGSDLGRLEARIATERAKKR